MKSFLFITLFFTSLYCKSQEVRSFHILEVNKEYAIKSDFVVILDSVKLVVNSETYLLDRKNKTALFATKQGVIYQIIIDEYNLSITTLDKQVSLIYFKD